MSQDIEKMRICVFGKILNEKKSRKIKGYSNFLKFPKTANLGEKSILGKIFLIFGEIPLFLGKVIKCRYSISSVGRIAHHFCRNIPAICPQ